MNCPKCGSKDIQYCTSTEGKGYGAGKGCLGYLLLGPLGLLCGGCGSGVSTEEFWICHDCGHKFTTENAQKAEANKVYTEQQEKEKYEKFKAELKAKHTDLYYFQREYKHKSQEYERLKSKYELDFERLMRKHKDTNKKINKYLKYDEKDVKPVGCVFGISALLTLITFLFGLMPLPIIFGALTVASISSYMIKDSVKKKKIANYLVENEPEFAALKEGLKKAKEEKFNLEYLSYQSEFVTDYEKKHNIQE